MFGYLKEACADKNQKKIIYFGRTIYAEEFLTLIEKTAGYLQSQGIKEGSVVGIALPNIPEAIIAFYAVNACGAIANLIHPLTKTPALGALLQKTKTSFLFVYESMYARSKELLQEKGIQTVVCWPSHFMKGPVKFAARLKEYGTSGHTEYKDIIKNQFAFKEIKNDGKIPAVYIHSGGTSGNAKTVVLHSYSFNWLADATIDTVYQDGEMYAPTDSMLMILPIFHGFGLGICAHTLLTRAFIVMQPRFHAGQAIKLIKKYRITHLAGVPAMYRKMMEHRAFRGKRLRSLSQIFCGGDRLPTSLKERFDNKLKELGCHAELCEGYGLTETTTVFSISRNGRTRPESQGQPMIGNLIKVVGEDGKELPVGEKGELHVKSEAAMMYYLDDPEETAAAMYDGWIRTGDIGYVDKDNYIYYCDRKKRSIKIAGENVFPSQVEEIINNVSGVKECCVARSSHHGKPYTVAYIVTEKNVKWDKNLEERIVKEIEEKYIRYAVPKRFVPVERLYRTEMAKIDYRRYEAELAQESN